MAGVKGGWGGARVGAGRKPKSAMRAATNNCCPCCAPRIRALQAKIAALEKLIGRKPAPLPPREAAAEKLLRDVAALIPAGLPADVREEAAQAIIVDILARKLTRKRLDAQTVRRYIRAAYGLRDPLRFRSLDAPVSHSDLRTLGESLAA